MDPVETSNDIQISDDGTSGWSDKTSSLTFQLKEAHVGKFFRSNSIAIDAIKQELWSESTAIGPVTRPLVVGTPVVTGNPLIGYTLTCSEPQITGGSGDVQVDYYWEDSTNERVLYIEAFGSTQVVAEADLGRTVCCRVIVTDYQTAEQVVVVSDAVGPINRPILPEYETYVDSELYDDPNQQLGVLPGGSVVCEVRPEESSNAALDITYEWKIRSGTGRLTGDTDSLGTIYVAPDSAPAGASVQCIVRSNDANDNGYAAEITILTSDEETSP